MSRLMWPPYSSKWKRNLLLPAAPLARDGTAIYDGRQLRKQPDWTYAPA